MYWTLRRSVSLNVRLSSIVDEELESAVHHRGLEADVATQVSQLVHLWVSCGHCDCRLAEHDETVQTRAAPFCSLWNPQNEIHRCNTLFTSDARTKIITPRYISPLNSINRELPKKDWVWGLFLLMKDSCGRDTGGLWGAISFVSFENVRYGLTTVLRIFLCPWRLEQ